jgi:RNA polymerase sigma-70 factor (ECF subfamily)
MEDAKFRELVAQARSGSTAAMSSLLVAGFTPLRSAITAQMGTLPHEAQLEPEDIIQEVYSAAWANLPTTEFDTFAAFLAWLRQIAENKLVDVRRSLLADKRDVRRQASAWAPQGGTYVDILDGESSPMSSPSRVAARSEATAILMVRMLQLPEDYRQVLRWRLMDGLSVAEVAKRLDRSEAAVHMLCHRALKQLRELMGAPGDYLTQK